MDSFDIPLFKKTYDLYKEFYACLKGFPKQDKYSLGEKCNLILIEILGYLLEISSLDKLKRVTYLERVSVKLNLFRVYVRLAKDIGVLENKKYILIQEMVNEIGRMLGGWIRSSKTH
ncbi:MAG: diversity-generating retroelement protein Avd [bacterium]|nr:diversity-generating retroelement protein Avd [bacterium]